MRRCFLRIAKKREAKPVFSAQAEVFLEVLCQGLNLNSFLRASGGVSMYAKKGYEEVPFSPRMRRCFQQLAGHGQSLQVFSARAEVFLKIYIRCVLYICFLRTSGGVSVLDWLTVCVRTFSPRMRRCFPPLLQDICRRRVFSAHAEVFLGNEGDTLRLYGFLRARGSVSFVLNWTS